MGRMKGKGLGAGSTTAHSLPSNLFLFGALEILAGSSPALPLFALSLHVSPSLCATHAGVVFHQGAGGAAAQISPVLARPEA